MNGEFHGTEIEQRNALRLLNCLEHFRKTSVFARKLYHFLPSIFVVSELEEKRKILGHILHEHPKISIGLPQFELLAALLESNSDELIKKVVQRIDLSIITLSTNAAHVVSSIMSRCDGLELFRLRNFHINDEFLEVISETLKGKQIHVSFSLPFVVSRFLSGSHETAYSDWSV